MKTKKEIKETLKDCYGKELIQEAEARNVSIETVASDWKNGSKPTKEEIKSFPFKPIPIPGSEKINNYIIEED